MHRTMILAGALLGLLAVTVAGAQTNAEKIAQAVTPLPEDLKAGAAVFEYDDKGNRVMLREGSNQVDCQPRDERGFTVCFPKSMRERRDLQRKLMVDGLEGDELDAAFEAAEKAGEVPPTKPGSLIYRLYEEGDRIQLLWVVLLPGMKSEDLGMSLESQRDPALAGHGRPWMMREGTPGAHLMIPINGTALSNKGEKLDLLDTKALYKKDPVAHAVLPLPADLRDGATVVSYDDKGNRKVLRQGSNMMECATRNEATGFTRCYHKEFAAESDLRAKLDAEGKSPQEIAEAMNEARAKGDIPAVQYGSLFYRMYEDDDKLKLLWVLRVPNATSADLGMSTASQRDSSLAGQGLPWMMREGTPSAHLMIPINGTELSNRP